MGKSQRRSDTGESKALSHNVFHPALKSDVFGASDTQVLSVSQTASLLHLSETRVLDLIESKVLCAKKDLTGKSWLIEKECALAQMTNFVKEQPATANPAQLPLEGVVGETFDAEPAEAEFGHIFSEIAIGDLGAIRASSPIERLEEALELQLELQLQSAGEFEPGELIGTAINTEDDGSITTVTVEAADPEEVHSSETAALALRFDRLGLLNRKEVTDNRVQELMDSLDFANVRLEGAMYRVGYLEAQVESLEQQLDVLPEFRSRAALSILIERENDMLKEKLAAHEAMLEETNQILEHFASSRWYRFFAWAFGVKLPDTQAEQAKKD